MQSLVLEHVKGTFALALVVAACTTSADPSATPNRVCLDVGDAVAADLDWSPDSDAIAVLRRDESEVSVQLLDRGGRLVTEVAPFLEIAPAAVSAGPDRSLYWQQRSRDVSTLYRRSSEGLTESWILPDVGVQALEVTSVGIIGTKLVQVGLDADVLDLVDVDLLHNGTVTLRPRERITGLKAIASSADQSIIATSRMERVADVVRIMVSGARTWSASIADTTGSHIGLQMDGSAILIVDSTDATARWVTSDGTVHDSDVRAPEVLAIDVAPDGTIASGSNNITGGDGEVCFGSAQ